MRPVVSSRKNHEERKRLEETLRNLQLEIRAIQSNPKLGDFSKKAQLLKRLQNRLNSLKKDDSK